VACEYSSVHLLTSEEGLQLISIDDEGCPFTVLSQFLVSLNGFAGMWGSIKTYLPYLGKL
jgi:hypothetical protein